MELEGKSHVRKRIDPSRPKNKDDVTEFRDKLAGTTSEHGSTEQSEKDDTGEAERRLSSQAGSYWLTRIVFTRAIGFIYCKH